MYVLSVQPDVVRRMRPGDIPPSIIASPSTSGRRPFDLCYSAELAGPFDVVYDPFVASHTRRSLCITVDAYTAITAAQAALEMARLEAAGRPAYVHANIHRARANAAGKEPVPIIAIRRGRHAKPLYANHVRIAGPGWLIACPQRMLPCSAKVYLVIPAGTDVSVVA
ncbi:hypothetical protein EKD04_017280 [Chloroflexales bacterium ZM16-3]|nr:hypothetical protein [Chloroflexales bacterium ZM16-3]